MTLGIAPGTCSDAVACETECDGGSADQCRRLAETYVFGTGVGKDEARATGLYERGCELGDPAACVYAGRMHEFAHGVPKDDERAARLYARACDLAWAAGCYNLAVMRERGTGVPQNLAKAAELYRVACEAGAKLGCVKAEECLSMERDGRGGLELVDGGPIVGEIAKVLDSGRNVRLESE